MNKKNLISAIRKEFERQRKEGKLKSKVEVAMNCFGVSMKRRKSFLEYVLQSTKRI